MARAALLLIALLAPVTGQTPHVVTDAKTGLPIASALVLFARIDSTLADSVVVETDERGQFSTAGIPSGSYRVFAEHDDYLRGEYADAGSLNAGGALPRIVIALTPTAVIAGRVLTETGEPAPKVYVRAHTSTAGRMDPDAAAEVRTNDLGEYRLFGLAPGAYAISAEPYRAPSIGPGSGPAAAANTPNQLRYLVPTPPCPDCRGEGTASQSLAGIMSSGGFIDPRALTGQSYPRVYFPNAREVDRAIPVVAEAGARIYGIDIQLIPAPLPGRQH